MISFSRVIRIAKRDGFAWLLLRIIARLLNQKMEIQKAKDKAWNILVTKYDLQIAYGPFKGMRLNEKMMWSANDRITQTLGIYEQHVMEKLINFSKEGSLRFVNIGAADGYFAVGMAYGDIYEEVHAFEISEDGQDKIKENSTRNNCAAKVHVYGEANKEILGNILKDGKKTSILIDVEGFEFEFLDHDMLDLLRDNYVICELHPWKFDNGCDLQKFLIDRASRTFNVNLIKRESYNPNCFEEFSDLSDEERLIAVGEGRPKNMNWLVLTPTKA